MRDDDLLTSAQVAQVLRRAVAIDTVLEDHLTVARLRAVAHEAGISDAALQRALGELPQTPVPPPTPPASWRWRFGRPIAATLGVGVVVAGSMRLLVPLARLVDPTVGAPLAMIAALGLGGVAALRWRVRPAAYVAGGLAVALAADLLLTQTVGPILGRAAHLAEFAAALGGVALGAWLARRRPGARPAPPVVEPSATPASSTSTARSWVEMVRARLAAPAF
jgi:hypothetical protein